MAIDVPLILPIYRDDKFKVRFAKDNVLRLNISAANKMFASIIKSMLFSIMFC